LFFIVKQDDLFYLCGTPNLAKVYKNNGLNINGDNKPL